MKDLSTTDLTIFWKKLILSFQFGFWQKYSTSLALIHLTDKIRHGIDEGNYACGIFVDFQRPLIQ